MKTIDDLLQAIEAARPKLGGELELPAPEDCARVIRAASRRDGRGFLTKPRRGATGETRAFMTALRWRLGGGSADLTSIMIARMTVGGEVFEKLDTLATVVGVLSGRGGRHEDSWRRALYG